MRDMAVYRNRYVDFVTDHFSDFDVVSVLDTDNAKGFSYRGIASSFSYDDWHVMASNGLLVPDDVPPDKPLFIDSWAYRAVGELHAGAPEQVNKLHLKRGDEPMLLWSCFGGLALYRMSAFNSGARYSGEDCEHVCFHQQLRNKGFNKIFLNPSQIVLYT